MVVMIMIIEEMIKCKTSAIETLCNRNGSTFELEDHKFGRLEAHHLYTMLLVPVIH